LIAPAADPVNTRRLDGGQLLTGQAQANSSPRPVTNAKTTAMSSRRNIGGPTTILRPAPRPWWAADRPVEEFVAASLKTPLRVTKKIAHRVVVDSARLLRADAKAREAVHPLARRIAERENLRP
jgi:hypothetical protein